MDATRHGPSCPQATPPLGIEDLLNGFSVNQVGAIDVHEPYRVDEFECLNLVVTAPQAAVMKKGKGKGEGLPVMVCIHGLVFHSDL